MPFELASVLLSGPDLGGGFLFQLTRDRAPLPEGFTVHLQEAGTDGGAAPEGSPELIGYRHPPVTCMYGGPGCWHLSFPLPAPETSRVRLAYNRTRFVMGAMLANALARPPAPVEEGLRELLGRITGPLEAGSIPWQIGGSAAAWIRGVPIEPRDIDLGTTEAGARRLGELLEEYLVEPVHPSDRGGGGPTLFGAAFVGSFARGIRVEWGAGGEAPRPVPDEWTGAGWIERREWVRGAGGFDVALAPLEFELLRAARRGQRERCDRLLSHLARARASSPLLTELLADPELPAGVASEIRSRLARPTVRLQA
ncbi:MAG: hypothetical protein ACREC5_00065 [Thermoplasmata archaeon]